MERKYYTNLLKVILKRDQLENVDLSSINKLYRFKRNDLVLLPRVKEIIGILKSIQYDITSIVDFGTQRGALMFPLLDIFPAIQFTGVDISDDINQFMLPLTQYNPYFNFTMVQADITKPIHGIEDKSVDMVLASEILEHLENPLDAVLEAVRIAKKYIIITVPSKPDNNPEHIQYFKIDNMLSLLEKAALKNVVVHPNKNYNLFMVTLDNKN